MLTREELLVAAAAAESYPSGHGDRWTCAPVAITSWNVFNYLSQGKLSFKDC